MTIFGAVQGTPRNTINGWLDVTAFGARADAISGTTGTTIAGNTTFTDTGANFNAQTDVGKVISLGLVGYGNVGSSCQTNRVTITSYTNNGGNIQVNCNKNTGAVNLINGARVYLIAGGTGVTTNLSTTQYYYAGNVVGGGSGSFNLYADAALATPIAYSVILGTVGTGGFSYGVVQHKTTIAAVNSATSVTLTAAPGVSSSGNVTYTYGTNNQTAFTNAISGLPSAGGTVYAPPGTYLFDWTEASPGVIATSTNYAIYVGKSNVAIRGAGVGNTVFVAAAQLGLICGALTNGTALSDITFSDFSVKYVNMATRYDSQYSCVSINLGGANGILKNGNLFNLEASNCVAGITFADQCINCVGERLYVHEVFGNGIGTQSSVGGMRKCGFMNCFVENSGDSAYAEDNIQPVTNGNSADIFYIACHCKNSGNYGIEVSGTAGCTVSDCYFQATYAAGAVAETFTGYTTNCVNVVFKNCWAIGPGTGAQQYNNSYNIYPGGFVCAALQSATNVSNVTIEDCWVTADGANNPIGPAVGTVISGTGVVKNLSIRGLNQSGAQVATSNTGGQLAWGTDSGIDIASTSGGIYISDVDFTGSCPKHGITIASTCTGPVRINGANMNAPNSAAAGSMYGFNILGGDNPVVTGYRVTTPGTLAGVLQWAPAGTAPVTNTFGSAGSINGTNTTTGGLTWSVQTGTITAASNKITSTNPGIGVLNPKVRDLHITTTVPTWAGAAASQLFIAVAADGSASTNGYVVDVYNGNIYKVVGGVQSAALVPVDVTYTYNTADTFEVSLQEGFLRVFANPGGTRKCINSFFVGTGYSGVGNTSCGLTFASTAPNVSSFSLRY